MIKFFISQFKKRAGLRLIASNSVWIIIDNVIRIVGGFFIGLWLARYLGPYQYGQLNYAIFFTGLFGIISTSAFNSIVARELINHPKKKNEIMGSAFFIKLLGSLLATLGILIAMPFIHQDKITKLMIIFYTFAIYFQSIDVIVYWFQATLKSKFYVYARNIAFVAVIASRLILLLTKADLIWFGLTGALEYLLLAIALIVAYRYDRESILRWQINIKQVKKMLADSLPVLLAAVFLTVYIKLDKVLVGTMLNKTSLGYYSVGTQLSDAWIFVPAALSISFYPAIIESSKMDKKIYHERLQLIYGFMTYVGILIALPVSILAKPIINLLYGPEYIQAATVLAIYTWVVVPQCVDAVVYKWIFAENLQKILVYRTLLAAVVSLALDLVLIPSYGILGATIAGVSAVVVSAFVANLMFKQTRLVFIMQIKAIFAPLHFYRIYLKAKAEEQVK
jgi:PST family polysaccharide transporter